MSPAAAACALMGLFLPYAAAADTAAGSGNIRGIEDTGTAAREERWGRDHYPVRGGNALSYELLSGYYGYVDQGGHELFGALEGRFAEFGVFFPGARFGLTSSLYSVWKLPFRHRYPAAAGGTYARDISPVSPAGYNLKLHFLPVMLYQPRYETTTVCDLFLNYSALPSRRDQKGVRTEIGLEFSTSGPLSGAKRSVPGSTGIKLAFYRIKLRDSSPPDGSVSSRLDEKGFFAGVKLGLGGYRYSGRAAVRR